ncbi:MAG TPA: hypothetical protein VJR23_08395 [Candidatus Acidoferrales bacterium]|nr:hypothetical protein [Candidatus Acidoferrales bacterium]
MERRKRDFPVCFEVIKATRFTPGDIKSYTAEELEAHEKSLHYDNLPAQPAPPAATAEAQPATDFSQIQPNGASPAYASPKPYASPAPPDSSPVPVPPSTSASFLTSGEVSPLVSSSTSSTSSTSSPSISLPPDFNRHSRRCSICSHPDRDAIEGDFIRWRSPEIIAREYKIADRISIYRHAHSTGLYARRRRELGRVLEGILEAAEHIPLESSDIVTNAVRIYAHLDENGKWSEPSRVNFLLTGPAYRPSTSISPAESAHPNQPVRPSKHRSKNCPPRRAKIRSSPRLAKPQISNRNSRQFKKQVKSLKTKEKTVF